MRVQMAAPPGQRGSEAFVHCALLHAGSGPTRTSSLPKFRPPRMPASASGAFSRSSMTSSRYRRLPSITQGARQLAPLGEALWLVEDDHALDQHPLADHEPEIGPGGQFGFVVLRNHPAHDNAGERIEPLEHRLLHARRRHSRNRHRCRPGTTLPVPRPGPPTGDRCSRRTPVRPARTGISPRRRRCRRPARRHVWQAVRQPSRPPPRQPRSPPSRASSAGPYRSCRNTRWCRASRARRDKPKAASVPIELRQSLGRRDDVRLPAARTQHDVTGREAGIAGGDHLADGFTRHHFAGLHGRGVGFSVGNPAAHIGVDRQKDGAGDHLARGGRRDRILAESRNPPGRGLPRGRRFRTDRTAGLRCRRHCFDDLRIDALDD